MAQLAIIFAMVGVANIDSDDDPIHTLELEEK